MIRFVCLSVFLIVQLTGRGQTIESIAFTGITKTDSAYLKKIIDCKAGHPLDSSKVESDVQTLKNLNLFFSVEHALKLNSEGNYELEFIIKEAVYLYPTILASGFRNQFKLQLGANQINFLGRAQSIGFQYQYYDRHSLAFYYDAPRHSNKKTGHEIALAKYSTVEPLYFEDTVSMFNFDNYSVSVGGFYWLGKRFRLGLGGTYMWEKYEQIDNADIGYQDNEFTFNKYQIRFKADYLGLNRHFEFFEGVANSFFAETIQTAGVPAASFLKFTNEIKYFKRLGKRGNLGFLNRIGISTNNNSPFAPFVLDSFVNIRGIGNRVARGTGELIASIEYRHTILRRKLFIAQLATFADYGTLRVPGDDLSSLFNGPETNLYLGGGIRLHSRFIYKTIFRIDYSVNPTDPTRRDFTFGLGQYF